MLKVTKPAANRVDVAVSGVVDAEEMRQGLDALASLSEDVRHGRMLYTLDDFHWPGLSALSVEFTRLPALFGLLVRFERCAVLCDEAWIRNAAEVEGALMPGLAVKTFPRGEVEAAEAWLAAD
jgi:hypothetical protein